MTVHGDGDDLELQQAWDELDRQSKAFRQKVHSDPIQEWRVRKGQFPGAAAGHTCSSLCTLEPIVSNTFGCVYTGTIHKCGRDECSAAVLSRSGFFVCKLTGVELAVVHMHPWSAALSGDMDTAGDMVTATSSVQFRKRRLPCPRHRHAGCQEVIRKALCQMLQNQDDHAIITLKWKAAVCHIRRSTHAYAHACKARHTLPNMAHVEDIAQRQMIRSRLWNRERCSDDRLTFYSNAICHLWMTVVKSMPANRTETHMRIFAIGCLYMIQHGFMVNGNRILPVDQWLQENLPLACEIVDYGFPKRFVTIGRNTLLEAFKYLVEKKQLKREDLDVMRAPQSHTPVGQ